MFYPLEAIKNQVIYKVAAVFMFDEYLKDYSQKEHFLIFILDTYLLPNGHIIVNWQSIRRRNSTWKVRGNYIDLKGESTWKLWHRFDVDISTWIRLSKSTKYWWVLHVDFSMSFRCQSDLTSALAVSILLFSNVICSVNLF